MLTTSESLICEYLLLGLLQMRLVGLEVSCIGVWPVREVAAYLAIATQFVKRQHVLFGFHFYFDLIRIRRVMQFL